jgi:hypothetical protein
MIGNCKRQNFYDLNNINELVVHPNLSLYPNAFGDYISKKWRHDTVIWLKWLQMGFGLVTGFTELLQLVTTSKDYALTIPHTSKITIGHTRSSQVRYSLHLPLLGISSKWWMLPFLWVPELSPASATSFSQQQPTTTEPQRSSKCNS